MQLLICIDPKPYSNLKYIVGTRFSRIAQLLVFLVLACLSTANAQEKEHTIQSGETLSSIAKKYHTTIPALLNLNPEARSGIKAGAVLKLKAIELVEKPAQKQTEETPGKHMVKQGESFYKIAKKYKVTIAELEKWNGFSNSDLKSGDEIWIKNPTNESVSDLKQPKSESKVEEKLSSVVDGKTHKVVKGETISTIAKKYGTTAKEIKTANHLKTNQINLDQILIIPEGGLVVKEPTPEKPAKTWETPKAIKEAEAIVKSEPKKETIQESASAPEPSPVVATPAPEKEIIDSRTTTGSIREVNNALGYTRVVETGFAEAIEGDLNSKKHLCLHKSAPTGSILQVKNEANGQSVFVKVIGKLPDTGSNEKLIIRISRQAYDRLLAIGKRFPVEVSYPESQ